MQNLINTHPYLGAAIGFAVAHFGHLTWAQVKEFGAFWESMHGWQGLIRFWKTGNPNPPANTQINSQPFNGAPIFVPQFTTVGTGQANQQLPPVTAGAAQAKPQPETK